MNTLKKWETTGESKYAFFDNGKEIGSIEIARSSLERIAHAQVMNQEITIKKVGTWKNAIEISDKNGLVIAKAHPEKWYTNYLKLEYAGKTYSLKIRNSPTAEYIIFENEVEIISYGLTTNKGKVGVKINTNQNQSDYIFDFLLWYLFVPIAFENMGDVFLFFMMIA